MPADWAGAQGGAGAGPQTHQGGTALPASSSALSFPDLSHFWVCLFQSHPLSLSSLLSSLLLTPPCLSLHLSCNPPVVTCMGYLPAEDGLRLRSEGHSGPDEGADGTLGVARGCPSASGAWHQLRGAWGLLPGALPGPRVWPVTRAEPLLAGVSEQVASQLAEGKLWARGVPGGHPGQWLSRCASARLPVCGLPLGHPVRPLCQAHPKPC